ncbi:MAG TPA: dTMP kinase, partial [Nitratifractor sp.]|nr:dTMP kinase [Nitratifractor sp.]
MYILFEGIDGCGKTTQIELLKEQFKDIVVTKEPGGTPFGVKARELLLHTKITSSRAELLLFLADRAEHYSEVIAPNSDKLIVSDRGFLSGVAYALEAGFDLDFLIELNRFALMECLPQKIVLFSIDRETLK